MPVHQISETIRVEEARARKEAVATADLLGSLKGYSMGGRDALGKTIYSGESFAYIDWLGPPVWRVYEDRVVGKDKNGDDIRRYEIVSEHDGEDAALAAAEQLAGA